MIDPFFAKWPSRARPVNAIAAPGGVRRGDFLIKASHYPREGREIPAGWCFEAAPKRKQNHESDRGPPLRLA